MVRTLHQQRNHQQRRKLAHAYHPEEPHRVLFQSVRDFLSAAGKKMRETRSFRRKV